MYSAEQNHQTFAGSIRSALHRRRNTILQAPGRGVPPLVDFARATAAGLSRDPRRLECRFLYDERGSRLYEEITRQPEYYPTRTEAAILEGWSAAIALETGPVNLLELGSGSSSKTGHLLSAYGSLSRTLTYLPVDVSRSALQAAANDLGEHYPRVQTVAIHGTYESAFPLLGSISPVMVVFLGSTIGNLDPAEARNFFAALSAHLNRGDFFLLGIDLVKDPALLEAAYNDAAGVSAAFTRNLFVRMNRELGSDIDVGAVEHVARWNDGAEQIEIEARFARPQSILIPSLKERFDIGAGESIRTEISRKFRLAELVRELEPFGFRCRRVFTDPADWFALLLLEKRMPREEAD